MNLDRRPLPLWAVAGIVVVLPLYMFAVLVFRLNIPLIVLIAVLSAIFVFASITAGGPGLRGLQAHVAPASVFTVQLDAASRSAFGSLSPDDSYYLTVTAEGIELWTIARAPLRAGVLPWSSLIGSEAVLARARAGSGTVAIEPVGDGGVYLDVKTRASDLLRRNRQAELLFELLDEQLSAPPVR